MLGNTLGTTPVIIELRESSPQVRQQQVTVTFPSSANTDIDIAHDLAPADPDGVDQEPVKKDRACDIQNDQSGTRKAWASNTLYLRCTVASAAVTLRLSIRRS